MVLYTKKRYCSLEAFNNIFNQGNRNEGINVYENARQGSKLNSYTFEGTDEDK